MVKNSKDKTYFNQKILRKSWSKFKGYSWPKSKIRRSLTILIALIMVILFANFLVAEWYINKHKNEPLVLGTTFVPEYATSFGLDPMKTLDAIFSDLGIRQVRLVSYWDDIEPFPGHYDFSELDNEFALANKYHAKVSLAIGLRQPRWPECHEPRWITIDPTHPEKWQPQLNKYMSAVVNRYKSNPALQNYQLENEYLMTVFGECKDFSRDRLVGEFNMVKNLDSKHPIIISRSDNWVGIPVNAPRPDEFGISIYKRVWDSTFTHRYFEYPLPSKFYAALAGWEELYSGRNMIIHELQTEPWTPNGQTIQQTSVQEQFKSMNATRMQQRINYAKGTGMKTIDLWGAEWWYWLKEDKGDSSVWNVVKANVAKTQLENQNLSDQNSPY